MAEELNRKQAIEYLNIPEKHFDNYFKNSREVLGYKNKNKWYFSKKDLDIWIKLKKERTIYLTLNEYEKCFEFAIKMVYGGLSLHGIRGQRTEVQGVDDVILGILAEQAVKKIFKNKFKTQIELDEDVHTAYITPQDIHLIKDKTPRLGVGIKGSKTKSAFLVLGSNEVEKKDRKSDVYIFSRVGLPSDHLFRILREHSFFGKVRKFLEENEGFRKIEKLELIPVWICGYVFFNELEKVTEIPGQKFTGKKGKDGEEDELGYRYVKSVKNMHNSDKDWENLIKKL